PVSVTSLRRPPRPPLLPYTTLFRSRPLHPPARWRRARGGAFGGRGGGAGGVRPAGQPPRGCAHRPRGGRGVPHLLRGGDEPARRPRLGRGAPRPRQPHDAAPEARPGARPSPLPPGRLRRRTRRRARGGRRSRGRRVDAVPDRGGVRRHGRVRGGPPALPPRRRAGPPRPPLPCEARR